MDEHPYFGREIVFQEDIERALWAIWEMAWAAQFYGGGSEASGFIEGCLVTLRAIAVMFGIPFDCERGEGDSLEE